MRKKSKNQTADRTICRDSKRRVSVKAINDALQTVPIQKEKLPEILRTNLDRLGIGYSDEIFTTKK